jgi:hypothetical protein
MILCILTITQYLLNNAQAIEQRFLVEPESVSVKEGDNVTLACTVDNKVGVLQWTKDDFGLGTFRNLSEYKRYRMVGEQGKTWNLEIVNVTLEDDAKFQCQVGATEFVGPIRSKYAVVNVSASPQPPVITAGPLMGLREGKIALVQCISKGGKPASVIRWKRNGELITDGVQEKVEKLNDSLRFITVSTLTFPVTVNLTGSILECEASNEADEHSRTVNTQIEVEYAPQVSMALDRETIYEGDTVRLSCKAEANPDLIEYQWSLDGKEVKEGRGAKELVIDLDRSFNRQQVTCLARNKIGQNSADLTIDVKYSPIFTVSPQDIIGSNGDKISLECQVDSNPPATYLWLKDDQTVGSGPLLSFALSNRTSGTYTCQALVSGYSPSSISSRVQIRGPPVILVDSGAQFGSSGETVHVVCEAESVPAAKTFSWSFNGNVLRSDSAVYSIIETQHGSRVRSTVIINYAAKEHFGDYVCNVENEIGSSAVSISLKEKEYMPLLIIISAAIGGFLLTIVVIVIVMTCRKVAKTKSDNSSWPQPTHQIQPDRFSNSSSDSPTESNTTSSMSTEEDLDGSDSLPEYHANYVKSQPDLFPRNSNVYASNYYSRNYSNSNNYSDYRHYSSEHDLLDQTKCGGNYQNPYLQSVSPVSDFSLGSSLGPSYGNIPNRNDPRYLSGRENALLHKLQGHVSVEELNETSIGTHV